MPEVLPDRLSSFLDSRFGISFHWGVYSLLERGEWVRSIERLSIEDYEPYRQKFSAESYDPVAWARLVKSAGAKYAVLTAKHHDGFCLFETDTTDYHAGNSPAGRDLIRPFVEACRAEGLRVGLYYSLVDWHHPDYPHYGDRQHPMRFEESWRGYPHQWETYRGVMHRQIEELLTHYGPLDQMVFDFSYGEFQGDKWGATAIVEMIRSLQPNLVFNDRLGGDIKGTPLPWVGDYDSPELNIPATPPRNSAGKLVPFEVWCPLNNSWGYSRTDHDFKSSRDLTRLLANAASKGGNFLLNLSPHGDGSIDPESQRIVQELGEWLSHSGESIYGTSPSNQPKPEWGWLTQKGNTLYCHITEATLGHINLPKLRGKIKSGRVLKTQDPLHLVDFWNIPVQDFDHPDDIFINWRLPAQGTYPKPDVNNTVLAFEFTSPEEEQEIRQTFQEAREKALLGLPFD